jgi:tripartite-type tricarboxylate transporter receptor subunit TctC
MAPSSQALNYHSRPRRGAERIAVLTRFVFAAALPVALTAIPCCSYADDYPVRPVRIVVPSGAGGGLDFIGRVVSTRLTPKWQHQIVIDNRAGAGGIIGTDIVAKAAPDGYTLLVVALDFASTPFLYAKLPYKTPEDFAPVTIVGTAPYILVAHPSSPIKTVKDLIAAAKEKPGTITYGSSGVGTTSHLATAMLRNMAGIDLVHVPYKGAGAAAAAVVAGEVPLLITSSGATIPFIKAGRLRPIAVTTAKRIAVLPDVPTIAESGVAGFDIDGWFGILAPKGTPATIVNKIQADIAQMLKTSDAASQLQNAGFELGGASPAEFLRIIQSDMKRLQGVIREGSIKVD